MKLFIWTNFEPDYTAGLAFAIAKNEEAAKKQIEEQYQKQAGANIPISEWGKLEIHPLSKPIARCVGGGG